MFRAARVLVITLTLLLCMSACPPPATATEPRPGVPWVGANPYGFAIGDSVLEQCHEDFGMGWRSLGYVGWPGATTTDMRDRLTSSTEGWPYTTEPSNAIERQWFRDAGWLAVALGTNDAWRGVSIADTRANIDWLMTEAKGRPVLWFDVKQSDPLAAPAAAINAELYAATDRWPNLLVLPWQQWATANADELLDGVHVKTYERGCVEGRNRLIQHGAPAEDAAHDQPVGWWYPVPAGAGGMNLTGWASTRVPSPRDFASINVRSDWGHVGRWAATLAPVDVWAKAAAGRQFSIPLGAEFRGHLVCLDLIDPAGQTAPLGCRTL